VELKEKIAAMAASKNYRKRPQTNRNFLRVLQREPEAISSLLRIPTMRRSVAEERSGWSPNQASPWMSSL